MNSTTPHEITADRALYIRELQRYLRSIQFARQGYSDVAVDGIFGTATEQAVRSFQSTAGLPVTGSVDRITWDAIFATYETIEYINGMPYAIDAFQNGDPPLTVGTQGVAVYMLQIMLRHLGTRYANLPPVSRPNGVYSENTAEAVRSVQRRSGICEIGITDKMTWDHVTMLYNQE